MHLFEQPLHSDFEDAIVGIPFHARLVLFAKNQTLKLATGNSNRCGLSKRCRDSSDLLVIFQMLSSLDPSSIA